MSRMMPATASRPPNLTLQPRVTLNFDLLTHKVDRFMPLPVGWLCQLASVTGVLITSLVTEERADE